MKKDAQLRIAGIEASNFKSLVDFKINLPRFSCLIGLNGAGKSTILHFIDFVSQLVRGDMKAWLNDRKWKAADLKSKLTSKNNIGFDILICDENDKRFCQWGGFYNPSIGHCTYEYIDFKDFVFQVKYNQVGVKSKTARIEEWHIDITFNYEGSILSALKDKRLPLQVSVVKNFLDKIHSLDLLAPEYLRQRTRESSGTLGLGGQNLASFLHEMSDPKQLKMFSLLKKAYPQLQGFAAKSLRSGWKQLEISENYHGQESEFFPSMKSEARHINDGMLRMIAILAELQSENRFLLFDEIENGINPELVELVINMLVETKQQVLVTTHSPMILNYLEDEVARKGVIYLYKTAMGLTKSIPFFSIPSLKKKLEVMGPGEAFVDTNLTELADEIAGITKEAE